MREQKGFTLVELMITVGIAAILISIATPSFRTMIINNRLNSISSELADVVSFARSESIKRNRLVIFCSAAAIESNTDCIDDGAWSNWLIKQNIGNSNEDKIISSSSINLHNGSIQVTTNITLNRINFSPDGLARSGSNLLNNAIITVCSTSDIPEPIRQINVGAASNISITKASGDCP